MKFRQIHTRGGVLMCHNSSFISYSNQRRANSKGVVLTSSFSWPCLPHCCTKLMPTGHQGSMESAEAHTAPLKCQVFIWHPFLPIQLIVTSYNIFASQAVLVLLLSHNILPISWFRSYTCKWESWRCSLHNYCSKKPLYSQELKTSLISFMKPKCKFKTS